ncbi:MAG: glutamyl-tRNA reductase [Clostridia bacterium]
MVLGVSHEAAPVAFRERIALIAERCDAFYEAAPADGAEGMVVLSTCNRTEVYWSGSVDARSMTEAWARAVDISPDVLSEHTFLYGGPAAVAHLFRVAAGLDSMMYGETQILGQVKDAYQDAQRRGRVGPLHRVLLSALRVGKRAHSETAISENALSMGYAGVEVAKKVFGDLKPLTGLVVGAGEMGTLVARHLKGAGLGRLYVLNRTPERAQSLASELHGVAKPLNELPALLGGADLVVLSTSAPGLVVDHDGIRAGLKHRRGRPWLFLDLSVPRVVEPGVERLSESVFRFDVDDLRSVVDINRSRRERAAVAVEAIIREEAERLQRDLDVTEVAPLIRSLRQKVERIRQRELEEALRRLPHLSDQERAVVERTTELIINKILNDPMVSIRGWAQDPEGTVYLTALRDLFRLDEDPSPAAPQK